jgi:hypothetical protein
MRRCNMKSMHALARATNMLILATCCGCSGPATDDIIENYQPKDSLSLAISTVDAEAEHGVFISGTAPLTVYARPILSNTEHPGNHRQAVSKLVVDFGDGSVEDETAALFAFADYFDRYSSTDLPVEQCATHTYTAPGVYELSGAVTWSDGTTTEFHYDKAVSYPPTVTVLAPEAVE